MERPTGPDPSDALSVGQQEALFTFSHHWRWLSCRQLCPRKLVSGVPLEFPLVLPENPRKGPGGLHVPGLLTPVTVRVGVVQGPTAGIPCQ